MAKILIKNNYTQYPGTNTGDVVAVYADDYKLNNKEQEDVFNGVLRLESIPNFKINI